MPDLIDEVKGKALTFAKRFGIKFALSLYHDKINAGMENFFASHTPKSWHEMIENSKAITLPEEFYKFLEEYKSIITMHTTEEVL